MAIFNDDDVNVAGNLSVGGNIINKDLDETFQVIKEALDGYSTADGYNYITRSVGLSIGGGVYDYDAGSPGIVFKSPFCLSGAKLEGTYSSGSYQGFYSAGISVPQDYHSGGQMRIFAVALGSGNVHLEITGGLIRVPDDVTQASFGTSLSGDFSVGGVNKMFAFPDLDFGDNNIQKGDLVFFRIYRFANDPGDTNSNDIYILGAELFYNAEIPKQSF